MGAEIIGVSVDSHHSHGAFAEKLGVRFPLASDFNREIVGDFAGYFDDVGGYKGVNKRRVLVLDRERVVKWEWTASVPAEIPDTESVREAVQEIFHEV